MIYVDTSAALKLVVSERESVAIASYFAQLRDSGQDLWSSMLLFTELHCASRRRLAQAAAAVNAVLDNLNLLELTTPDLQTAGTSEWGLRSADAIHLAVALRLGAHTMVAYDAELLATAQRVGLATESPGR